MNLEQMENELKFLRDWCTDLGASAQSHAGWIAGLLAITSLHFVFFLFWISR